MRVRCIALFVEFLLYELLSRFFIDLILHLDSMMLDSVATVDTSERGRRCGAACDSHATMADLIAVRPTIEEIGINQEAAELIVLSLRCC